MKVKRKGALAALLAMVAALVGRDRDRFRVGCRQGPVVIGWAYDSKGNMSPFDDPALAAATGRASSRSTPAAACSSRSSPATRRTTIPAKAKACALSLLGQGANVIFTTCDVDFATPVVQEAINRGVLAIAPCIGTDEMGPKRFGAKGALAFSFGNVAQDEGSAMAQWAWGKGWKTAGTAHQHAARVLQGSRAGLPDPLQAARRQDRRPGDLRHRRQQRRRRPSAG